MELPASEVDAAMIHPRPRKGDVAIEYCMLADPDAGVATRAVYSIRLVCRRSIVRTLRSRCVA